MPAKDAGRIKRGRNAAFRLNRYSKKIVYKSIALMQSDCIFAMDF